MTMPAAAVSCLWTESYSMHRSQDTAEHALSFRRLSFVVLAVAPALSISLSRRT